MIEVLNPHMIMLEALLHAHGLRSPHRLCSPLSGGSLLGSYHGLASLEFECLYAFLLFGEVPFLNFRHDLFGARLDMSHEWPV